MNNEETATNDDDATYKDDSESDSSKLLNKHKNKKNRK